MPDWTDGYVADVAYTHGYYPELNPQRLRLAFLVAGRAFPEVGTACELGYGQGISTNVHAAASVTEWHGTDFNPTQAAYARGLSQASGARAMLVDEGFEEFCQRTDLPDFDFIGLHGIWSWISDHNRTIVTDFLRRKLKVGGVVYISYNTQPGWAPLMPLRELLTEHARVMGAPGAGTVPRIESALAFAEKLMATGALYGRANPAVSQRLAALKTQDRNYLAHEYFNQDWMPMSFSALNGWLSEAKLSYATSAHYLGLVDPLNHSAEQQALLREIPDVAFREAVRDVMVNQQFRKDYWVRGPRTLAPLEQLELLRRQRVVLVLSRERVTMTVSGAAGEANMEQSIYELILARLEGHCPCSVQELEDHVKTGGIHFSALLQALLILMGKSAIELAQDDATIHAAAPIAARLNRSLCEQARYSSAVSVLASPVTGGGIGLGQVEQLVLLARAEGMASADSAARFVTDVMEQTGQRLVKEGKTLDTPKAAFDEALRVVQKMDSELLPMLSALGVTL